jgi:parvulin-like peptidyl-prolyl isomerase
MVSLSMLGVAVVSGAERELLEAILIRVNDRVVTVSEFETRVQQELAQIPTKPVGPALEAFREQLLDNIVNEMILMERAEEKNIIPDEGAIDQAVAGLREENNLQDDLAFEAALEESGLTEESLRERYRRSFMVQRAAQGEVRPMEITSAELEKIYERDKETYAVPAKVELQQMIFPVAADESDVEAVVRRVQAMLERVKGGADLQAEATLAGVDLQDLGAIPRQDLRPELLEMLEPLEEGDFSQPAVTSGGIQVLRLVRRIPAGYRPFEEVEGEIRRRETERVFYEQRSGFIDKLKENYLIEVHRERLGGPTGSANG